MIVFVVITIITIIMFVLTILIIGYDYSLFEYLDPLGSSAPGLQDWRPDIESGSNRRFRAASKGFGVDLPLIANTMILVGSHSKGLCRIYREPTKIVVLVVEGKAGLEFMLLAAETWGERYGSKAFWVRPSSGTLGIRDTC